MWKKEKEQDEPKICLDCGVFIPDDGSEYCDNCLEIREEEDNAENEGDFSRGN